MNLIEKICAVYPELTDSDFISNIVVVDFKGELSIMEWNHPTLARPTDEELA